MVTTIMEGPPAAAAAASPQQETPSPKENGNGAAAAAASPPETPNSSAQKGSGSLTAKMSSAAKRLLLLGDDEDEPKQQQPVGRDVLELQQPDELIVAAAASGDEGAGGTNSEAYLSTRSSAFASARSFESARSQMTYLSANEELEQADDDEQELIIALKRSKSTDTISTMGNFLLDPPEEMTWGRRIALHCMKRYAWYNPRLLGEEVEENEKDQAVSDDDDDVQSQTNQAYPFGRSRRENPSLERAWAYREHQAMSRYVVPEKADDDNEAPKPRKNMLHRAVRRVFCKGGQQLQRAEPGETEFPTRLYQPVWTPHKQLGDFGLGIGLYFSTLRAITVITFLAGILNTPNFMFFAGTEYNAVNTFNESIATFQQGSAICTDTMWVPCADCGTHDSEFANERLRPATRSVIVDNDNDVEAAGQIWFALRNNCDGAIYANSFTNYATLFWIILGTVGLNMYLRRMEVLFDEDEQTAQDYSIVVENPPGDATDPEEWHRFFHQAFDGAHATACTIAVDNDLLVRSLVERREILRKIEMMVEPGTSLDTLTLAGIAAAEERQRRFWGRLKANLSPGVPELFARVVVLNARVQGLAQQDYPATKVFVTFETEAAQRRVLEALNFGSRAVKRNKVSVVADPNHLFRGNLLLAVREPDEPNTVRWQDLNEKFKERFKQQCFTFLCTVTAILVMGFVVWVVNGQSVEFAAITIAVFNSIFPMFAKFLTSMEAHSSESGKQRSLYLKISLFRWANTAVVITIITPFTNTVSNGGLIEQIYALFIAEIVTTNAIQLLDPMGHVQRHILAPRAATQDAMNLAMQGEVFELAERYTNMTKILFLALWYCAIYPGALFMCSFALLVNYFVDKFSLMRTWKRPPQLGTTISAFSRRYFFSLAIVAMAVMSSYYFSAFPFDNLCAPAETNTTASALYAGEWTAVVDENETQTMLVSADEKIYHFCLQDFFRYDTDEQAFPFISKLQRAGQEWMTDEQETIADVHGWTSVGVLGIVALSFVYAGYDSFRAMFRGTYEAKGEDQGIPFSEVPSISTYVPEIESPVFSYPLLACNIDGIDHELLEWTDPDRPDYVFYDLTKDAEVLLRGTDVSSKVVFSQIAHFPPGGKKKKPKEEEEVVVSVDGMGT